MSLRVFPWAACAVLIASSAAQAVAPEFQTALIKLCDGLIATQNLNAADKDYGALVCPSTNPQAHPAHSRGAEAVYPFAVAYKRVNDVKYANAAVKLGNWLITIQNAAGAWGEDWPGHDGWDGTTADQLISMAGAYAILKDRLTPAENTAWINSMRRSADWIEANFPKGNLNYLPTGAVALKVASNVIANPPAKWMTKAGSLMATTVASVNSDDFIIGEGKGIDLGYNIAQSIGYIALYGILTNTKIYVDMAARVLKVHNKFMYPNGAMDNSWGTRSFKWTFESGTKTAPGIPFTFALLADRDPAFNRGAQLSVEFLAGNYIGDKNLEIYGPHASRHATSSTPCIYSSFARAQSLATAIEYAPAAAASAPIPSETKNWSQYFTTARTALIRTDKIMATVTTYGEIGQYSRPEVVRGGSITNLWFEGYGPLGFLQVSSQTNYTREEDMHMPIEGALLPLTARIEKPGAAYAANLYDDKATLALAADGDGWKATAAGSLKDINGAATAGTFTWVHRFFKDSYASEVTVGSAAGVRIVEPFVDLSGNQYALAGDSAFRITTAGGGIWEVRVTSSTGPFTLASGEDKAKYWSPFPAVDCHPLILKLGATGGQTIKYTVSQITPTALSGRIALRGAPELKARLLADGNLAFAYSLSEPAAVRISLRAPDGRRVAEVFQGSAPAGDSQGRFDASRLPKGMYLVELAVPGRAAATRRIALF
jgi:hypothetical protein